MLGRATIRLGTNILVFSVIQGIVGYIQRALIVTPLLRVCGEFILAKTAQELLKSISIMSNSMPELYRSVLFC